MNKELEFLIYNTSEENISVNAVVKNETIWLTQKAMAELFNCSVDNISLHLKNIYREEELEEKTTTEEISIVQKEGNRDEFKKSIDEFLSFRRYDILEGKGKISKANADKKVIEEYNEFNKTQKITSDFDKEIKKLLAKEIEDNE